MTEFHDLLHWKLLSGSHKWPGPDGGTCINEAAVVVAGFPYRSIRRPDDCPPCFSRPISAYAIGLNDRMPDHCRQRLLPFVTRLSGSADSPHVECERAKFIALETIRRILPVPLGAAGLSKYAEDCRSATDLRAAAAAAGKASAEAGAARAAAWAAWAAREAAAAAREAAEAAWAAAARAAAARAAAEVAWAAWAAAAARGAVYDEAILILDGALRIGRQAEPIYPEIALARMEAAKAQERITA